jgi:hypothetical protein
MFAEPLSVSLINGGLSWTTVLVGLLNLLVGGALVAFIRSRPSLRKIDAEREANLLSERAKDMSEMRERLEKLETAAAKKDEEHQEELRRLAEHQEAKDRLYDAQKAADRHRINNLNQAFQGLLMLLKKGVTVEDAVQEIEKMRNEQLAREAAEAAAIRAAAIKAGLAEPEGLQP